MLKLNGKQVVNILGESEAQLLEFVSKKRHFKPIIKLLQETIVGSKDFPQITDSALKHFLYSAVFTNRRQITEFIKAYSSTLSPEALEALKLLHNEPMEWVIFRVEKNHGKGNFRVFDHLAGGFQLSVPQGSFREKLATNMERLFASLIFSIDNEWYSFTLPQLLPNLEFHEILQFFEIVDSDSISGGDITTFVKNNYLQFFLFYSMYPSWEKVDSGGATHFFWGEFLVEQFEADLLLGEWVEKETVYGYNQFFYSGISDKEIKSLDLSPQLYETNKLTEKEFWDHSTHHGIIIYWDEITERGYFRAHSPSGLALVQLVLDASFELIDFSLQWGFPDRLFAWISFYGTSMAPWSFIIDEPEPFFRDINEIDHTYTNVDYETAVKYMDDIAAAYYVDKVVDWKVWAHKHALQLDLAERLYKDFLIFNREEYPTTPIAESEQAHRINYPLPSVETMLLFKRRLDSGESFFLINENPEVISIFNTYTNNRHAVPLDHAGLDIFFAQLFEDKFGEREGVFLINALFYILASSPDTSHSVRGLALELIHLYGHIFLKTMALEAQKFITIFSRFVITELCPSALLEVINKRPSFSEVANGDFRVKPSVFFRKFIELPD